MNVRTQWIEHENNESPEVVAVRFERSEQWANEHIGQHRCVDGRIYVHSCLVSDPSCDTVARGYMRHQAIS